MNEGNVDETNVGVAELYSVAWELLAAITRETPRDLAELAVFACPAEWLAGASPLAAREAPDGWTVAIFEADYLVNVFRECQASAPSMGPESAAIAVDIVAALEEIERPGRADARPRRRCLRNEVGGRGRAARRVARVRARAGGVSATRAPRGTADGTSPACSSAKWRRVVPNVGTLDRTAEIPYLWMAWRARSAVDTATTAERV